MQEEQNKSVGWVAIALGLLVAYFAWAFLCAGYHRFLPPIGIRTRAGPFWIGHFVNSIVYLPEIPSVLRRGWQNQRWIFVLTSLGEAGVLVLWIVMRKLEREVWSK